MPFNEDPTAPEVPLPSNAPVLISVTEIVSFVSTSLSFFNTSFTDPSVTVKVLFVDISIVLLSLDATGASLAPVIVKVI